MAQKARDISGAPFVVGSVVSVRCLVTAITPVDPLMASDLGVGWSGAGDTVTLLVETPGNVGEKSGVTLQVSPVQCKRVGATYQQ